MEKEEIDRIARSLTGIKTLIANLQEAYRRKDSAKLEEIKKSILNLQMQIEKVK